MYLKNKSNPSLLSSLTNKISVKFNPPKYKSIFEFKHMEGARRLRIHSGSHTTMPTVSAIMSCHLLLKIFSGGGWFDDPVHPPKSAVTCNGDVAGPSSHGIRSVRRRCCFTDPHGRQPDPIPWLKKPNVNISAHPPRYWISTGPRTWVPSVKSHFISAREIRITGVSLRKKAFRYPRATRRVGSIAWANERKVRTQGKR